MYNTPDSSKIEPRFKQSIDIYVTQKIPTGGFLRSVLENNLSEAIGTADIGAMDNIRHIVCYLYNEVPAPCWGSKETVSKWLQPVKEEA